MTLHSLGARSGLAAHEREIRTCLEGMVLGLALRTGMSRSEVAGSLASMCLEMSDETTIEQDNEKRYCTSSR